MPKIFIRDPNEFQRMANFYAEIGEPYIYERSGNSRYLIKDGITYYSASLHMAEKGLPSDQLFFVSKIKRYILKNNLHKKIRAKYNKQENIKYFAHNRNIAEGEFFDDCYSVDIDKAYWTCAYHLGYVDTRLYKEGLKIDKRVRLAALGTFAKRKYTYVFDGKKEKLKNIVEPLYPHVFLNCAWMTYKLMNGCKRQIGDDFLFYWTDGIYCKNEGAAEICMDYLGRKGYDGKVEYIERILRTDECFKTFENGRQKKYAINLVV